MCTVDDSCVSVWPEQIVKKTGQTFPGCPAPPVVVTEEAKAKKEGVMIEKKVIVVQPFFIQPTPAEDCRFDWDYKFHGINWKCNCNEGLMQSPVNLPPAEAMEYAKQPAKFDYNYLSAKEVEVVNDRNIIRIRALEGKNFGKLTLPEEQDGQ